jgi:hypothetical protein
MQKGLYYLFATSLFWLACASNSQLDQTSNTTQKLPAMEQAVVDFLASLDAEQTEAARFAFADTERYKWHFSIVPRVGLDMRKMNEEQKELALALLRIPLSEAGYQKARDIMQLERVLQQIEELPYENDRRNPQKYFVSIFGDPAGSDPWGWRFEGHHLSLNFSSVDRQLAVTPAFWGSNPAIVREGEAKGTEVLKAEQDLGRRLVKMLDQSQLATALIADDAPDEIVTYVHKKAVLDAFEGLEVGKMTEEQKSVLEELLNVYLSNMEAEIAKQEWDKLKKNGLDELYFAWAGGLEPGDRHYYRIHGPHILIEYDNTQNDANHIHTVWRDLDNDWGEDLLRKHLENHPH